MSQRCEMPPPGWYCTRSSGHDGPCAAWPIASRSLYLDLPLAEDVQDDQIVAIKAAIYRHWRLYGQVYITNAGGLSLLDPLRISVSDG